MKKKKRKKIKKITNKLEWVFATKCHKYRDLEYSIGNSIINAIGLIVESREKVECPNCKKKSGKNVHLIKV